MCAWRCGEHVETGPFSLVSMHTQPRGTHINPQNSDLHNQTHKCPCMLRPTKQTCNRRHRLHSTPHSPATQTQPFSQPGTVWGRGQRSWPASWVSSLHTALYPSPKSTQQLEGHTHHEGLPMQYRDNLQGTAKECRGTYKSDRHEQQNWAHSQHSRTHATLLGIQQTEGPTLYSEVHF